MDRKGKSVFKFDNSLTAYTGIIAVTHVDEKSLTIFNESAFNQE